MPSTHEMLCLARRIHAVYEQRAARSYANDQPNWPILTDYFHEIAAERRLIAIARVRGWHLAAGQHIQSLRSLFRQFAQVVRDSQARWAESVPPPDPSLRDLFLELQHIHAEFDDVAMEIKKAYLEVQTDAIVLKEVELGRFSIRLYWPRLIHHVDVDCFDVVALDPNPPAINQDVTHPHVKSNNLCAGDATVPLKKALEQGRLTDAFHMVRSVLETYNPHSAHVKLDDWGGKPCWECGASTDDDCRYCESCSHDVCGDCSMYCEHCGTDRCTSCQGRCGVCKDLCCPCCLKSSASSDLSCCPSCRSVCAGCDAEVATSELDDESQRCPVCLEAQAEPDNPQIDAAMPAATPTGESS